MQCDSCKPALECVLEHVLATWYDLNIQLIGAPVPSISSQSDCADQRPGLPLCACGHDQYLLEGRTSLQPAVMTAKTKSHRKRAAFDAMAGAMSGCLARFAVGPLDVLKIRFQVPTRSRQASVQLKHQRMEQFAAGAENVP